jgi:N,N'-diacetyllegionaminate synthase
VASRDIQEGEVFTENNLTAKRPGTGISPMEWNEVIGTKAEQNYVKDDLIQL